MDANSDIREAVFSFVAEYWSEPRSNLTDDTTLFADLCIDGDDGDEILEAFSQQFHVDMSKCDAALHFGSEGGCLPITPLYWLYTAYRRRRYGESEEQSCGLVAIRIKDLVRSAESHEWFYPAPPR